MPGVPATSPKFGAPRFADADDATFSAQVNGVTDVFDAEALKTGGDESLNSLAVTGAGSALNVTNDATVGGQLKLSKQGAAGGLLVGGDATLYRNAANSLRTGGALTVDGATTLSGTLAVTGNSTLTGTLAVNGAGTGLAVASNATVGGTLVVTGQATLNGNAVVTGSLTATTDVTARQGAATAVAIGAVGPGGASGITFRSGEAGSNLYRSGAGALTIDGNLTVSGTLTVTGGVTYTGLLTANAGVASGTVAGGPAFTATQAAADVVLGNKLAAADANRSFAIQGDGSLHWGPGGATAVDSSLYRVGASNAGVVSLVSDNTALRVASFSALAISDVNVAISENYLPASDRLKATGSPSWRIGLGNGADQTVVARAPATAAAPVYATVLTISSAGNVTAAGTVNATGYQVGGTAISLTTLSDVTGKTGTGSTVVMSASPTLSGTVAGVLTFSSTITFSNGNALTLDQGAGTNSSTLTLTGRNAGAANSATIKVQSTGQVLYNVVTGQNHVLQVNASAVLAVAGAGITVTGTSTLSDTLTVTSNGGKSIQVNQNDDFNGIVVFTSNVNYNHGMFVSQIQNGGAFLAPKHFQAQFGSPLSNVFYVATNGQVNSSSTSIAAISDRTLKTNLRPLDGALGAIRALNPLRFDWKRGGPFPHKAAEPGFGLVAQDVEKVLPHIVHDYEVTDGGKTLKSVAYGDLIPWLVGAIQELAQQVDELRAQKSRTTRTKSKESADASESKERS